MALKATKTESGHNVSTGDRFFVMEIDLDRLDRFGPPGWTIKDVLRHIAEHEPLTYNSEGVGYVWTENAANVGHYRVDERAHS